MYCNVERQRERNRQGREREKTARGDLVVEHESAGEIPAAYAMEAYYLGFLCVGLSREVDDGRIPPSITSSHSPTSHEWIGRMLGACAPAVWECLLLDPGRVGAPTSWRMSCRQNRRMQSQRDKNRKTDNYIERLEQGHRQIIRLLWRYIERQTVSMDSKITSQNVIRWLSVKRCDWSIALANASVA